jgi:hypothetical protein
MFRYITFLLPSLILSTLLFPHKATGQSYDTMVLKNVPKKYVVGKLVSFETDYLVYFREGLPNGPQFRMLKANIRWVITAEGELLEISDTFDPLYQWRDSITAKPTAQPAPSAYPKSVQQAPVQQKSTEPGYYVPPPARSQAITPNSVPYNNNYSPYRAVGSSLEPRDHFFTIGFGLGGYSQRLKNLPDVGASPRLAYHFEMGYLGFVGNRKNIFVHPTIRFSGKSVSFDYSVSLTDPTGGVVTLDVIEQQSLLHTDVALLVGIVLSESKSKRAVFYAGPFAGIFLGGDWEAELTSNGSTVGTVSGSLAPGTFDPNSSGSTQFYRPFELGLNIGFRFQASSSVMLGPDLKLGLSNISPKLSSNVSAISTGLPEQKSTSIQFVTTFTL